MTEPPRTHFPTPGSAQDYLDRWNDDVKKLDRLTVPGLRALHQVELAQRRITPVLGAPRSKDDYIRDILEMRFPHVKEAQGMRAAAQAAEMREQLIRETSFRLCGISTEDLTAVLLGAGRPACERLQEALKKVLGD